MWNPQRTLVSKYTPQTVHCKSGSFGTSGGLQVCFFSLLDLTFPHLSQRGFSVWIRACLDRSNLSKKLLLQTEHWYVGPLLSCTLRTCFRRPDALERWRPHLSHLKGFSKAWASTWVLWLFMSSNSSRHWRHWYFLEPCRPWCAKSEKEVIDIILHRVKICYWVTTDQVYLGLFWFTKLPASWKWYQILETGV